MRIIRIGVAAGTLLSLAAIAPAQETPKSRAAERFVPTHKRLADSPAEEHEQLEKRTKWFYGQRAYPNQHIPPNARLNALAQAARMNRRPATAAAAAAPGAAARESAVSAIGANVMWTPMGPAPIGTTDAWTGRVTAIAVDPRSASTVYAGTSTGGVWKTTDGGNSWTPLTDDQPSLAIGAVVLDPNNPDIVYAGTGDGYDAGDQYWGAGLLKSTDAGAHWTQIGTQFLNPKGGLSIGALAISRDSKTILAAVAVPELSSLYGNTSMEGIYRSIDGGVSFSQVLSGSTGDEVIFSPADANTAFATLGETSGSSKNGVYKSTDAGVTWVKMTGTTPLALPAKSVGRIELALAPSNPAVLYAGIESTISGGLLGMYKTTDAGQTWSKLSSTPNYCDGQCGFDNVIRVHPNNPDFVLAGGSGYTDDATGNENAYLIASTNGGVTWTSVDRGTLHPDHHALAFSADATRLYDGNDGGIWVTTDTSVPPNTWTNLNTGMATVLFNPGLGFTAADPNLGYAGTQDNDTVRFRGNGSWDQLNLCGDGGWSVIDSTFTSQAYAACSPQSYAILKRLPVGGTWIEADFGLDWPSDDYNFYPPMTLDPSSTQRLYYGTSRIWRTVDGAGVWKAISKTGDLSNQNAPTSAVAVSPADPNIVWTSTEDGNVRVTSNALADSPSWSAAGSGLPDRYATQIAPDPYDPNTAVATYSGFSTGHVFKTINRGATWQDISANLPNAPANDIIIDPDLPGTYYLGMDVGMFITGDGGLSWAPMGTGLPNVVVSGLSLHRATRTLRAGTYGRSMWQASVPVARSFAPVITSLSPASINTSASDQPITISGANFTSGSVVQFNGAPLPTSVTDASTLTATIPAADLATSARATLTVLNAVSPGGLSNPANLDIGPAPASSAASLVNSASGVSGGITPGGLVTIYGSGLASGTAIADAGITQFWPNTLSGSLVFMGGYPASFSFVSPTQVNVQVPWELEGARTVNIALYNGTQSAGSFKASVAAYSPALFAMNGAGSGQGAILLANTSTIAAPAGAFGNSRPATQGSYIELFGTGFGPVSISQYDGTPAPSTAPLATCSKMPDRVTIGGIAAPVSFCGLTPGAIGLYQLNVQVPAGVAPGNQPVIVTQNNVQSNTVTVAIQ